MQLECCGLNEWLARAPLRSSIVLRAAASTDGKIRCRRKRHAQLTPFKLYGLVRQKLHEQVAAVTFVARERLLADMMYPVPAITLHQGPATGGSPRHL